MANEVGARGGPSESSTPMTESLVRMCAERPDLPRDAVVVLAAGSEDVPPESLGLTNYAAIPYQPGMFKATMTGAALLRLAQRPEVEAISPDDEVTAI